MAEAYREESYEEEHRRAVDFNAAMSAGLLIGLLIALFPRGSPWSGITFFSPTVMGRTLTELGGSFLSSLGAHLALSVGYAIIIGLIVDKLRRVKAVIAGGVAGAVLFLLNWAVFKFLVTDGTTRESLVLFTHVAFGLITAGAYKGLSKPPAGARIAADDREASRKQHL
jgi:predicted histidine transporter YuiF (NhaC family)